MKKIIIFADTHGNLSSMEKVYGIMKESDYIIHLGDYQRDILSFKEFKDKIYSVKGNCDGGGEDVVLEIEGAKLLLTHGDKYGVKNSLEQLISKAKELKVDAIFFGHTHDAYIERHDGIYVINPGSTKGFYKKTYCYAVINDKQITAKIVPIF